MLALHSRVKLKDLQWQGCNEVFKAVQVVTNVFQQYQLQFSCQLRDSELFTQGCVEQHARIHTVGQHCKRVHLACSAQRACMLSCDTAAEGRRLAVVPSDSALQKQGQV